MPGLFAPSPANPRQNSRDNVFAPAPRLATTSQTTGRLIDSGAHETRKRFRQNRVLNSSAVSSTHPHQNQNAWTESSLGFSRLSSARSPPPLANDRYELKAGGIEAPNMFSRQGGECDYDDYFQLQKQRGMWSAPTSPPTGVPTGHVEDTEAVAKPWMFNQILSLVGGVAGKLVQFCAVPFRGFQAGGGQAYTFTAQGESIPQATSLEDPFVVNQITGPVQRTFPGEFPDDNYGVLSIESLENEQLERPRMTKRLRTGENWVVIDKDGSMESRPSTPRLSERRLPAQQQHQIRSPSQIPRPVSRAASTNATPKRPSLIPVSRRSTISRQSFQGTHTKATPKASVAPRSYSRQSYGSPVMFQPEPNSRGNAVESPRTPLPVESQRLINKMKREELEDDARLRRMSSQMADMLRQAQEALGTRIEVDDYMDDDGGDLGDGAYVQREAW
ncbi:hypothetical protein P154DRAFT_431136 [Amniculicola lignicola CBS 123094]|uniref:Uncharacterized protein n=1 Tax=Amniculicola lignicola CBS 123094 TaxID=1392246 RepID=A0A6A5WKJ3_9PLEO|nr:hypothetical protein P154DRAFT_431136 [Amniculicola lignicola CBS 123094]